MRVILLLFLAVSARAEDQFFAKVGVVDDFAREVRSNTELVIKGSTRGAFRKAELIIIAPRGRTFVNKDNLVNGADFTFTVRFEDGPGRYRMEIMAHSTNSTRSVGRFSVWYAKRKPKVDPDPPPAEGAPTPFEIHPRLLEKRWLARLNAFRKTLRLKPVGWNEAVSARAREHAERMARARRHVHKFPPYGGLLDLLRKDGAGKENPFSGPAEPWPRIAEAPRPFPLPAPQPRGPKVVQRVVPFVHADVPRTARDKGSLEKLFIATYEREAAFRISAADPHCLEVGIGMARPPRTAGAIRMLRDEAIYISIGFVQINDRTILDAQERTYQRLLKEAKELDTELLRTLGRWGRGGRAAALLARAHADPRPAVASAAFDGLLLLDEDKARDQFARAVKPADNALSAGRYGDAAAAWRPFSFVAYDDRIRERSLEIIAAADKAALKELETIAALPEPEREKKLKALLARAKGLPAAEKIRAAAGP